MVRLALATVRTPPVRTSAASESSDGCRADRGYPRGFCLLDPAFHAGDLAPAQDAARAQHWVTHRGEVRGRFRNSTILLCRSLSIGFGLLSAAAASCGETFRIADTADLLCSAGCVAATAAFSAARFSSRHSDNNLVSPE
jgi:hypothetical protein